jgi:hypothetical protein
VVRAGVVLALRQVDPRLAAVRRVDLGHERGGYLHDPHATLVDGGAEAGHVSHHAAAQGNDVVVVVHARGGQRAQQPLDGGQRLVLLALRYPQLGDGIGDPIVGGYRGVSDHEAAAGDGPEGTGDQALADVDRVAARGGRRPQELGARRCTRERAQGAHALANLVTRGVEQHGVGERVVERPALGVQRDEARVVAGQGAALVAGPTPRRVDVDVEQHHRVPLQQRAHALGVHGAATERHHRRGRPVEQAAHDLLLDGAEGRLAVRLEVLLDRGAEPALDLVVGVEGPHAEHARGGTRRRRLAGTHEPDED